ncbi:MAG: PD40 domain-containing protein [Anaerolineales bacterium]|nr:PD40 domain-containing protein [Anaerolineales bacterium]
MSSTDPMIGQRIDNYLIKRKIGEGGMAVVYLAEDTALKRAVVIKMMLPHLAQQEELRLRFQREAQATAQLHHQNIVPVYTTGNAPNGQPYIAFQYVTGGSLSDKLHSLSSHGQWISVGYALSIARQIAAALVVAHKAHIIHRDLKPSNILLRDDGTPVLADLGIAAVQQATIHLTQTGGILGTPDYMSPEQAGSQMIDGRSDIYSLGVILHELLSGQLPFEATSPWAMVHHHVYEQPTPLQQVRADLTPQTYQVVATCLQKKPADRYADAAALAAALDAAWAAEKVNPLLAVSASGATVVEMGAAGLPLKTETLSSAAPVGGQKRPLLKIAFFALMGFVLVAIAFFLWRNMAPSDGDDSTAPGLVVTEQVTEMIETAVVPTATPVPTIVPTATTLPTVAAAVPSVTAGGGVSHSSLGLIAYSCGPDGLGQIYLFDPASNSERRLPGQPLNSIVPSFAHDGQQIAYRSDVNGGWQIFVSNLDGSNQHTLTGQENDNFEPVWSPDDGRMAFVSDRSGEKQIYMMNSDGTNQQRLTFSNAYEDDPTWSVNDQLAFESNRDGRYSIYRLSLPDGQPQLLVNIGDSSTTPAWSPDGNRIAFESRSGTRRNIWITDRDGSNVQLVTSQGSENQRPAWSPDGRFLAYTGHDSADPEDPTFADWVVDTTSGIAGRFVPDAGMWAHLHWASSPDAAAPLAFLRTTDPLDSQRSSYTLWLMDRDGSNARQIYPPANENSYFPRQQAFMAWGPTGEAIAFIFNNDLYLYTLADGAARRLTEGDAVNTHPTWAPYGTAVAPTLPAEPTALPPDTPGRGP